jgi:hypothetical protein
MKKLSLFGNDKHSSVFALKDEEKSSLPTNELIQFLLFKPLCGIKNTFFVQ